jgi:hypothetical protein
MNRRTFVRVGTLAGGCTLLVPSLLLEGCESIKDLLNVVLASAEAIVKVAEPNASWLSEVSNAVAALEGAESNWEGGSPISIVESALNTLEAVLGVIPLTAVFSPLVDVLVAGIEAVLNAISPAPSTTAAPAVAPRATVANPHRGRVTLKPAHAFQTRAGAYKQQFNAAAKAAGLSQAQIQ